MRRSTLWMIGLICCLPMAAQATASVFFIKSMERGNYSAALGEASSPALKTYALWRYLRDPAQSPSFGEVAQFISQHPDWPDQKSLIQRGEKALFQSGAIGEQAMSWVRQHPPVSGYGKLVQARNGGENATALVKEAWINGDFDQADEKQILSEFASHLSSADHQARMERLLANDRASIAERLLPRMSSAQTALYRARIALIRMDRNVEGLLNQVPSDLKNDDGLQTDRAIWRDRKGMTSGAQELLRQIRGSSANAQKLWPVRAKHARELIEQRRYGEASALLANHGKLESAHLADALWLHGWVLLEYLNKPQDAYETFYKLYGVVNFPVSKARAAYWAARAADKNGNQQIARDWYGKAADHPMVFYGQLAHAVLHPNEPLRLPASASASSDAIARMAQSTMLQAAKELSDGGGMGLADPLIRTLTEDAQSESEVAAIVLASQQIGLRFAQVRAAKVGLQKNVAMVKEGWPVISNPEVFDIELPLAYAISRQESEFNPRAISSAGARGLMQLMPATARVVSRQLGFPYAETRLFEPNYNMRLGSHYLGNLISGFDGSYILAIAGYNAGPGRSRQWTGRFGRPGQSLEHTINWMETIPFAETRNYVQRVLENLQVYRALTTPNAPLNIQKDLLR